MPINTADLDAVIFDFGNTLIEFGSTQTEKEYISLEQVLTDLFGACDGEKLRVLREKHKLLPYHNGYRENNQKSNYLELVKSMYNVIPTDGEIKALIEAQCEAFLEAIALSSDVVPIMERLRSHYRLGLLSNYPSGGTIRDSLRKLGIAHFLEAVVVSGDVGYIKPHPKPFETMLERLALSPHQVVIVGDSWLADIEGAKRIGMQAILLTQYAPYEQPNQFVGDYQPDASISCLAELETLLLRGETR